jgi:hypothetical protein
MAQQAQRGLRDWRSRGGRLFSRDAANQYEEPVLLAQLASDTLTTYHREMQMYGSEKGVSDLGEGEKLECSSSTPQEADPAHTLVVDWVAGTLSVSPLVCCPVHFSMPQAL